MTEDNYLKYVAVKEWTQSQLREKKVYKNNSTGYTLQEHISINYTDLNYVNIPGINFIRKVDLWYYFDPSQTNIPSGRRSGTTDEELHARNYGSIGTFYTIINHPIESAISVKTKEQTVKYEDGGSSITIVKGYEYQNLVNALPTKETTTDSDGKLRVSRLKYTSDVATTGDVYSDMISNRNMVNNLIEQTDFLDGIQTKYVRTNYFSPFTNMFVPQNIIVKKGIGSPYTFHEFKRYNNKGEILEQQSKDGINEVYLWGYQEQFPVAKVVGTDYTTVITKVTQAQINAATAISNNDVNVRNLLNNLRTIPGAMAATYTYDPLIDMTSEADANNRIIYYEYDGVGRLMIVRDQDKKVLKKICYNYAGQPESCTVYGNIARSGTFIKTCIDCKTGSSVVYTVPKDTYTANTQAAADQLAQNDINANGQAYANAQGTCSIPVTGTLKGTNQISLKNFTISLVNINPSCGTTPYTYTLNGGSANVSLGSLPSGNYNITVTPVGGNVLYTCIINGISQDGSSSVSFPSQPVSNGTLITITPIL